MAGFLLPVLALITWSLLIWILMYARRLPAMNKVKMDPQAAHNPDSGWKTQLDDRAQFAAHNYNHLMEQPTIFYALMFCIVLMNVTSPVLYYCAWAYVALRVLHSLVQVSVNKVVIRFGVFSLSTVVLIAMAVMTILAV